VTVSHFDDSSALPLETAEYDGPQFPPPTRTPARSERAGRPGVGVGPEGDYVLIMTSRAAEDETAISARAKRSEKWGSPTQFERLKKRRGE
jgi:hypothetical protein